MSHYWDEIVESTCKHEHCIVTMIHSFNDSARDSVQRISTEIRHVLTNNNESSTQDFMPSVIQYS